MSRHLTSHLMVVVLLIGAATHCWAGAGVTLVFPTRGVPPKSQLVMEVDTRWPDKSGVRPIKITFRPIGQRTFPADRTLEITVQPKSWGGAFQSTTQVIQTVQIPEKASAAEGIFYLPTFPETYLFSVEVREQGRLLRDLSFENTQLSSSYNTDSGLPTILVIDKDVGSIYARKGLKPTTTAADSESPPTEGLVPDMRSMVALLGESQSSGTKISTESLSWSELSELTSNLEFLVPSDLPQLAMGLASVDIMVIDLEELVEMAEQHPASFQVLRNWMILGGNLVVSQMGNEYQRLPELDRLLKLPTATGPEDWLVPQPRLRGQTRQQVMQELNAEANQSFERDANQPDKMDLLPEDAADLVGPGSYRDTWYFPRQADYEDRYLQPIMNQDRNGPSVVKLNFSQLPKKTPFVVRRAHLGTLFAVCDGFAGLNHESWNWIINTTPNSMPRWESRFGLSLSLSNDGYWDFLIPGVGLPPVTSFHILLTLFVIAIGPVNYFLLQRRRQLNWLLVTVPVGAGVAILGLLAFAVLTDGLASRGRVRSLTHIDRARAILRRGLDNVTTPAWHPALVCPIRSMRLLCPWTFYPFRSDEYSLARDG